MASTVLNRGGKISELEGDDGADGASQPTVELKDLFNYGRIKRPFTLKHLLFALYLPFGIALLPFRVLFAMLCFTTGLVVPKSQMYWSKRLLIFAMGIYCKFKGLENLPTQDSKARIIACNHLTDFDPYPLNIKLRDSHILVAGHIRNIPIVGSLYLKMNTIFVDPNNKEKARTDTLEGLAKSKLPLVIYPEGGLTNGQTGIMQFAKFVFGLGHGIVPVAMKMTSPWPVHADYLGSSWFKNFFWWLLVPYHTFEIEFLPHQFKMEDETDIEFSKRVQTLIASNLGIAATNHAYAQKKELAKTLFSKKN